MRIARVVPLFALCLVAAPLPAHASTRPAALPAYDHIVVVIEENHSFTEVSGNATAPYLSSLANGGAKMTQSFAVTHRREPNYIALFSGSTQGVTDDSCPHTFSAENLGHQLIAAGRTFAGYSEGMPSIGYTGCTSGRYARKHNPWADFSNVPSSANKRFSDFPTDLTTLPRLSFVVPNLCNDMHDCGVSTGDTWLTRRGDCTAAPGDQVSPRPSRPTAASQPPMLASGCPSCATSVPTSTASRPPTRAAWQHTAIHRPGILIAANLSYGWQRV